MKEPAPQTVIPREQFLSWQFFSFSGRDENPAREKRKTLSFFWARNAIYCSLKALGISANAHVLLPAYLCRAAVEPFEVFGANVEFYSVGRTCEPDFAELEAKITPRTQVILAVHYFGFAQQIEKFRAICDRHRIALIEDCAHVLQSGDEPALLGSFGDASVFSCRKFLPTYDGGDVWLNTSRIAVAEPAWQEETLPFTFKVAKSVLDKTLESSTGVLAGAISWTIQKLMSIVKALRGKNTAAPIFELDSNRATFDTSLVNQKMSSVSQWIRNHSNVPTIIAKRRQNFRFLLERLRGHEGVCLLHVELPAGVCPWILPLSFPGIADAHLLLQREGVPAVNWNGVRPPSVESGRFPDADFLYGNLIFIPVHQNISAAGLNSIVSAIKKIATRRVYGTASPELCKSPALV
jgi:dTDP-4-amino-4,6-dideoxygalactose transaminase